MTRTFASLVLTAFLMFSLACSTADQENASQKAAEAKQKAGEETRRLREEARTLGHEAKQETKELGRKIEQAVNTPGRAGGSTETAKEKLQRGTDDLRAVGAKASVKLDHAAMIAKVKAKLATQAGLSTLTSVDVDSTGQVVTLRGTVSSEDQKQQAEQAVMQVSGVSKVVDDLKVKP